MIRAIAQTRLPIEIAACCLIAISIALFFPGYATSPNLLGMLLFVEIVLIAVWDYDRRFFSFLILTFFFAGTDVPPPGFWYAARWFVLSAGAVGGLVYYLRDGRLHLGKFHLVAFFCLITATVSSVASEYQQDALFKALSLCLLFLYAASGIRIAVLTNERQFFSRMLLFCELLTYLTAISYFVFRYQFFGNPNSLGAVMGVLVLPLLLWGVITSQGAPAHKRYLFALLLSVLLLATSYARAGILAATVSCAVVCVVLRRQKLLMALLTVGLLAALTVVFFFPPATTQSTSLTSAFIYKGHPEDGILGSRKSPWEKTVSSVKQHPWFGTGFGTSTNGTGITAEGNSFRSAARDTREHGNSYLAILEWVGILGVLPFGALLIFVMANAFKALSVIRHSRALQSPIVPIVGIVIAGMFHAAFEDWLFAVGYYLCVIFWAFAFLLADYIPVS